MSLIKLFEDLPDVRRRQGQMYGLNYVLVCSVLSILSGAKSYRDIHRFIKIHLNRLNGLFGTTWKKAPAYTTIRGILSGTKKEILEWYFRRHSHQFLPSDTEVDQKMKTVIAVDGKGLNGSFDYSNEQNIIGLISAYCAESELILGHIEVENDDCELAAVQRMLQGFGLKDCLYTLDALHCQKKHSLSLSRKATMQ